MRRVLLSVLVLTLAISLRAAVSDYVRTEIRNYNGNEGLTLVKYDGLWKDGSSMRTGQAWIVKADLTYGYRITAKLGDSGGKRATIGDMAEEILAGGVEKPICGINADYFYTSEKMATPVGFVISDSRLAHRGAEHFDSKWNTPWVPGRWFIMETADHQLVHAVPEMTGPMSNETFYVEGYQREITAHRPIYSWSMSTGGKKIRNALQTGWCNYPVRDGKIYIIGNGQDRKNYPRVLVGLGTNELGHAQLAFFLNDGRQADWSYGVYDEDSANMMIAEGCTDVGEFDGGGSAQMWMESGKDSVYPLNTTEHGGYLNKASSQPLRADATGLFLLKPRKRLENWAVGDYLYETEEEAQAAAADGETVRIRWIEKIEDGRFRAWFAGDPEAGTATGGAWTGLDATNRTFLASAVRQGGKVRLVSQTTFVGVRDELALNEQLASFAAAKRYPQGAVIVTKQEDKLVWRCLVREGRQVVWKRLIGEAALFTTYYVMMDLDLRSAVPRIRYLVSTDGESFYVLHDGDGTSWFDGAAGTTTAQGLVEFLGSGGVHAVRCVSTSCGATIYIK